MTEQEAIKVLRKNFPKTCKMVDGRYKGGFDDTDCDFGKALLLAISSLEEIQQYRAIGTPEELKQLKENGAFTGMELAQLAIMQMELKKYMAIGTVEECRVAVEKQRAKICNVSGDGYADGHLVYDTYECPSCGEHYELDYDKYDYCPKCGQYMKIELEDEEDETD